MLRTSKPFLLSIAALLLAGTSSWAVSSRTLRDSLASLAPQQVALARASSTALAPISTIRASEDTAPQAVRNAETMQISLYYPDSNCQTLVPEPTSIPKTNSLEAAVALAIEKVASGDFDLAGYRTSVSNGVATIDLRLSPDSPRHFFSMSGCEQFALFGSLRKTLLDNPQLNLQDVRFTADGEELLF